MQQLHTGYNLKASAPKDQGPIDCLHSRNLTESDAYIIHWSGGRKPLVGAGNASSGYRGTAANDRIERLARSRYMAQYQRWWSAVDVKGLGATTEGMRL